MPKKAMIRDLKSDDLRVAVPMYTIAEAARHSGVPPATFGTWAPAMNAILLVALPTEASQS